MERRTGIWAPSVARGSPLLCDAKLRCCASSSRGRFTSTSLAATSRRDYGRSSVLDRGVLCCRARLLHKRRGVSRAGSSLSKPPRSDELISDRMRPASVFPLSSSRAARPVTPARWKRKVQSVRQVQSLGAWATKVRARTGTLRLLLLLSPCMLPWRCYAHLSWRLFVILLSLTRHGGPPERPLVDVDPTTPAS